MDINGYVHLFGLPEDDLAVEGGPIMGDPRVSLAPRDGFLKDVFRGSERLLVSQQFRYFVGFFERFPFDRGVEHLFPDQELGPEVDGLFRGLPFVVESGNEVFPVGHGSHWVNKGLVCFSFP